VPSAEKLLNDYLAYLEVEKNRSPKTRENYERYLRLFLKESGVKDISDLTEEAVRDFRVFLTRRDIKKTPKAITSSPFGTS